MSKKSSYSQKDFQTDVFHSLISLIIRQQVILNTLIKKGTCTKKELEIEEKILFKEENLKDLLQKFITEFPIEILIKKLKIKEK